jgi:purine-nucleoside/S-methyl-5'-thioadenosine phosphorylase / adenosine deaminase
VPPLKTSSPKRSRRATRNSPVHPSVASPWSLISSGNLRILQLGTFKKLPWLVHGFSTRPGGVSDLEGEKVLNLGFTDWDTRENVLENRRLFQAALGVPDLTLVPLKQFHSDLVHFFPAAPAQPCRGDASSTNTPSLLLGVQTADCVPILLVDPKNRAVAAVHAGWRGTLARIAEKTVGQMQMHFGSKPADLLAALGPAIGPCCYEVGAELVTRFTSQFAHASDWFDEPRTGEEPNPLQWLNMAPPGHQPAPKNVRLDLRKASRAQLLAAGLRDKNIFVSDLCTACRPDLFFSYRKQGTLSGRLLSVIGIR